MAKGLITDTETKNEIVSKIKDEGMTAPGGSSIRRSLPGSTTSMRTTRQGNKPSELTTTSPSTACFHASFRRASTVLST